MASSSTTFKARSYVGLQLVSIAWLAFTSANLQPYAPAVVLVAVGLGLGIWAVAAMALHSRLSVMPQPQKGSRLLRQGIYRYLRHPMYTAVLLACLGMVLGHPVWYRWLVWLALLIVLCLKLLLEEALLRQAFPEYVAYQQGSWRLIPWIW